MGNTPSYTEFKQQRIAKVWFSDDEPALKAVVIRARISELRARGDHRVRTSSADFARKPDYFPAVTLLGTEKRKDRGPGVRRVQDPEVRGSENRVVLPLSRPVNGTRAAQQCAAGEINAVHRRGPLREPERKPILSRQIDEVATLWRCPEHVTNHKVLVGPGVSPAALRVVRSWV